MNLAAHPVDSTALADGFGWGKPVVRYRHAPAVILEKMELDVGGIPVAHCVGDALYGDLGKAICDLRILRQYSLKLHRNIHALKGFPQQLQAWAGLSV